MAAASSSFSSAAKPDMIAAEVGAADASWLAKRQRSALAAARERLTTMFSQPVLKALTGPTTDTASDHTGTLGTRTCLAGGVASPLRK
jgi:hypothetical protein